MHPRRTTSAPTARWARRPLAVVLCALLVAAACSGDGDGDGSGDAGQDAGEAGRSGADAPEGTVLGDGEDYQATIRRSAEGVPHITADDLAGLSFGQGWASGEDRTCDLADQVVKINGERARWFGAGEEDANLASDLSWRAIGIRERAEADWAEASNEVRQLVTAYADGWNAHLAEVGADEIEEWCAGEEWVQPVEPVEVYAYARSIALQASSGAVSDLLGTAVPPTEAPDADADDADGAEPQVALTSLGTDDAPLASNGWAIGAERAAEGGGMLVANPHFPWEGELRFWEVHLTVPGELDIYGVQLSGLPGIGIGFTETFGWTHTVSAGNRFTAYSIDLVPGTPTSYRYGDEEREMTSEDVTVEVMGDDGELTEETRTLWSTHYGPVLDFPGVGWTAEQAITLRDANIDNDEFIEQYLAMMQADDLDEFIAIHRDVSGIPLFNTVATSADGRAWYADTSATPMLSDDALAAYEASLEADPLAAGAADAGAVLLDGSDPMFEWEEVDGARDPGLVPYDEMPVLERDDYVFNANDSFWMAHATELLAGDYSPLHGRRETPRSPRTRENATVLDDTTDAGPSGDDGAFSLDELAAAAVQNTGFTSRALREAVVERCRDAGPVTVPALLDDEEVEQLPAGAVDVTEACTVLDGWDGTYDLDSVGPPVWRELMGRYSSDDLTEAGGLWAEAFDPADPVATPSGLAAAPGGASDPLLENLARAVQILEGAGLAVDVPLGDIQVAARNGTLVPIHGGGSDDGTTNIVSWGGSGSILDPAVRAIEREPVVDGSNLAVVSGSGADGTGYRINYGASFMMALAFTNDGPEAQVFLTYANTSDREAPAYLAATEAFSAKEWRPVAFTEDEVADATESTTTVQG